MLKKEYRYIFFGLFIFFLSLQPAFAAPGKPALKMGVSGAEVATLQEDLQKLGFFKQSPTGYYGAISEAAVEEFQRKYGLVPDGKAGVNTLKKIDILLKRTKPVKIVVDAGHGGVDKGASRGNVVESEVNLSVSKKLQARLTEYCYDVAMTRSTDTALDGLSNRGKTRQERDLNARTDIINRSGARFFVSIHADSNPYSPSDTGSIVYYNDKYPESKALAESIQKALNDIRVKNVKRKVRSCREANFYILCNSSIPGVLIETAFITNAGERKLLATDSFRELLAGAILTGIENTGPWN